MFGSHTTSTEITGSLALFAIVAPDQCCEHIEMIWNTKLGSTKCKPDGKYCKDHTRNRFCTKFASSLYFVVGEFAGQQRINMKYVTKNICKTRHCGHYLMETKTKDNWLSDHANMDQIIKILLIKEVHNKNQTAEEKLKWNDAVSLVNLCIHIRHCHHTL